jgi:predicted transcriptional regulator
MREASGTSVNDWSKLLAKARRRRQVLLIWLAWRGQEDGYSLLALAHVLGVSRSYLYALYSGHSDTANIEDQVIDALGRYLRQPRVIVRCAAGQIRLDDFFTDEGLAAAVATVQASLTTLTVLGGQQPSIVSAYAGVVADIDLVSRRQLRHIASNGPSPRAG